MAMLIPSSDLRLLRVRPPNWLFSPTRVAHWASTSFPITLRWATSSVFWSRASSLVVAFTATVASPSRIALLKSTASLYRTCHSTVPRISSATPFRYSFFTRAPAPSWLSLWRDLLRLVNNLGETFATKTTIGAGWKVKFLVWKYKEMLIHFALGCTLRTSSLFGFLSLSLSLSYYCIRIVLRLFFIYTFEVFFPRRRSRESKRKIGNSKCFFLYLAVSRDTFSEFGLLPPVPRVHFVSFS